MRVTINKKIKIWIASAILVYLVFSIFVYIFCEHLLFSYPNEGALINEPEVLIRHIFPPVPGVSFYLKQTEVDREVKSITHNSPFNQVHIDLKSSSDGLHKIKNRFGVKLFWVLEKDLEYDYELDIDTQEPEVDVVSFSNNIAVPTLDYTLKGKTEPDTEIYAYLNEKPLPFALSNDQGVFYIRIAPLNPYTVNKIEARLIDPAGNESLKSFQIQIDKKRPKVYSFFPPDKSKLFGEPAEISVKVEDNETPVKDIIFYIDGESYPGFYDETSKTGYSPYRITKSGKHEVGVKIFDYAGNFSFLKWTFDYDAASLKIDLSQRRLYLFRDGKIEKTYPVAVGMRGYSTPVGNWEVIGKRKHPTWRNPNKPWSKNMPDYIPPGPSNPLGPRAIEISASLIRIHGTPQVWSIGRAASHGCVRMYPRDVIELFDLVDIGMPVVITP